MNDLERRTLPGTVELRATEKGPGILAGMGIPYNVLSGDLGGFRERIAPGAANSVIQTADVRGLFNHDPSAILGRREAGTLRMSETKAGVSFEVDLPDTTVGRDVAVSVERRDVTGNSFAFMVGEDTWDETDDGLIRTVLSISDLRDIGPVTYPAYENGTNVTKRAIEMVRHLQEIRKTPIRRYLARLRQQEAGR